jgi:catechol 2,3-dioxygenase-like lactoylglutathione lyase family enzyme
MKGTLGITHIQLAVKDVKRSVAFYTAALGMVEKFEGEPDFVFLTSPGSHDTFTLNGDREAAAKAGDMGGIQHFGFGVPDPADIDRILAKVEAAGGKVIRRGERDNGTYAFIADPDGYKIEIYSD